MTPVSRLGTMFFVVATFTLAAVEVQFVFGSNEAAR